MALVIVFEHPREPWDRAGADTARGMATDRRGESLGGGERPMGERSLNGGAWEELGPDRESPQHDG